MPISAIGVSRYGPLEQLKPVRLPAPSPGRGEVLVRIHASALNPADYKVILGKMKLLHARNFPLVVGYDFSGTIESVGSGVVDYKSGDEVFGFLPYSRGNRQGAFAEMIVAKVGEIAAKPVAVTHIQAAAAATSGSTVLQSLRNLGHIEEGHSVLVTGASGGVGSLAIWIARKLGASVTAVGSGPGLELARQLGAHATVDRTTANPISSGYGPFDIVFDAAAGYRWKQWKPMLKPGGTYVTTLPSLHFVSDKLASVFSQTRVALIMVKSRESDLQQLGEWLASGFEVPLDSVIPVKGVAGGLARLMKREATGKIAVKVLDGF